MGQTFRHQPGRTVTEADNVWFSCLTMNPQSLHVDFHAAAKAEFGKPLVNSLFTLGDAEREEAVDQRLAELGLRRRMKVDVERLGVHREAREPHVVRLGDRPAGLVPKGLSHLEVLQVLSRHVAPPDVVRVPCLTAVEPDSINDAPWKTLTTSRSSAAASWASPPRGPSARGARERGSSSSRRKPSSPRTRPATTRASSTPGSTTSRARTRRSSASRARR